MAGILAILALTAQPPAPIAYTLRTELPAWGAQAVDVNGDGLRDLAAITADSKVISGTTRLEFFLADATGSLPSEGSRQLDLGRDMSVVQFAELNGRAPSELLVFRDDLARIFEFADGDFRQYAEIAVQSLFPRRAREPKIVDDFAKDLDGDGMDEWLLPTSRGFTLYRGTSPIAQLETDYENEFDAFNRRLITHRLAGTATFRSADTATLGIACYSDRAADFYYGDNWREHKQVLLPAPPDDKWDGQSAMEDIDADGFPDIVVTQTRGSANLQVVTEVYIASAPFEYPSAPTASFTTKTALSNPYLRDVDGDTKIDLVFVTIPIGVRSVVNYLFRHKLTVQGTVHLFGANGFSEKPTFQDTVTLDAPEGREQIAFTLADFTGDGKTDAAIGRKKDEFAFFEGGESGFLAPRPWALLSMPAFGDAAKSDVNGNGGDDLILVHPASADSTRIDVVVF